MPMALVPSQLGSNVAYSETWPIQAIRYLLERLPKMLTVIVLPDRPTHLLGTLLEVGASRRSFPSLELLARRAAYQHQAERP